MAAIRVLIVDDSVVVRKVLSDTFAGQADLEVAGTAASGSIALQKIPQVNPDVVLLDVEMPDMSGLEVVKRIRAGWPHLPVIMCSSLTERGAETSMRALASGASDCIAKPSALSGPASDSLSVFRADLLARVRAVASSPSRLAAFKPAQAAPPPSPASATVRVRSAAVPVTAIGLGASTGGPNALAQLFAGLPTKLPVPIFLVQHMPPLFTRLLAERLAATSGLPVHEASDGQVVEAGNVYIAPGDFHMTVVRDLRGVHVALNQEAPESSCRPAVDVLFRSLTRVYGGGVLAAVMTGMGRDGARGSQSIVDAGGSVIVQDAASCVVPSMPGAVVAAGLADGVYPLDVLALELVRRLRATAPLASAGGSISPLSLRRLQA